MSENYVENIEIKEDYPNKKYWYKSNWAFWGITLFIAITLSVLCAVILVPSFFGDDYYPGPKADLIEKYYCFISRISPYVIGIIGFISGLTYNIKNRYYEHTIKQYILSILSTCLGLLASGIIWFFLTLGIIITIIAGIVIAFLGAIGFGGLCYWAK